MSVSNSTTQLAIWERIIRPEQGNLPPEVARYFLTLSFGAPDLKRMHELAGEGQEGTLRPDEQEELRNYRQVGWQIDLLHSMARRTLSSPQGS
jgi:hypothetical protein